MENAHLGFEGDPFVQAFPEHRQFWLAAARGELLIRACSECHRSHWYPRVVCPFCESIDTVWKAASGGGTLHAFSLARRAEPPHILAYVTLDEGPTLMTNMIHTDAQDLRIGQRVTVVFQGPAGTRPLPFFMPAGSSIGEPPG